MIRQMPLGKTKMAKNRFIRALLDPVRAAKIVNRRYLQIGLVDRDPEIKMLRGWPYGNLERESLCDCFPGIAASSYSLVRPFDRTENMSLTVMELNALLAIQSHLKARKILEIGTFDGGTTVNLAANVPEDGTVVTVDLPPEHATPLLDIAPAHDNSVDVNIIGRQFIGTLYETKIKQVFGDSAKLQFNSIGGPFDLIYIDGCHDYAYVKSDSEKALTALDTGGVIIWHDYSMIEDVARYVDELSGIVPVRAIKGTRLAVHCSTWCA